MQCVITLNNVSDPLTSGTYAAFCTKLLSIDRKQALRPRSSPRAICSSGCISRFDSPCAPSVSKMCLSYINYTCITEQVFLNNLIRRMKLLL